MGWMYCIFSKSFKEALKYNNGIAFTIISEAKCPIIETPNILSFGLKINLMNPVVSFSVSALPKSSYNAFFTFILIFPFIWREEVII